MEKYDIKKLVNKVCAQQCSYDMERITQKEAERVDKGNVDNIPPMEWHNYTQRVYDVYGYVRGGKFRNYLPEYKLLVDKLRG